MTQPSLAVAFCSIWERTDTWLAIGADLERRGIRVFHIMTPVEYVRKAQAMGIPDDRILWLRKDEAEKAPINLEDLALLREFEKISGTPVKHLMLMDRFLRTLPNDLSLQYIVYIFRRILDFIEKNDIYIVSGEPSTIHDLISAMICKVLGREYTAPFHLRLPVKRFVLWNSWLEKAPFITGAQTYDQIEPEFMAMAVSLRQKAETGERLKWVANKSGAPKIGVRYLKRISRGFFIRALVYSHHDANMYTVKSVFKHLKYHKVPVNHLMNRIKWNSTFEQPVKGEKFVLFGLNVVPEYTTDVEAPYFMNSLEVIRQIARSLPMDTMLYVKEHPAALGIRGPAILKAIKAVPGVRLIDPYANSHELVQDARITVSLAGSISMEAAMLGKHTVILSDMYVRNMSTCDVSSKPWEIGGLLSYPPPVPDVDADLKYVAWLLSNSHEGSTVDRIADPEGLATENIAQLANAYEKMLVRVVASQSARKNGVRQIDDHLSTSEPKNGKASDQADGRYSKPSSTLKSQKSRTS